MAFSPILYKNGGENMKFPKFVMTGNSTFCPTFCPVMPLNLT